jgi:hypothetical protein
MKRIALLVAVVAGAVAGSAGQPVASAKEPAVVHATAVLALVGGNQSRLAWLNPRTLEQLKRGVVKLGSAGSPVMAPGARRVAVGSSSLGIRIVDVVRMKLLGSVAKRSGWTVSPIAWPSARRLFAIEWSDRLGQRLIVADPISRLVISRIAVDGYTTWARTADGIAGLGRLDEGIGPASLLVVDGDGQARRVALDRIPAGGEPTGTEDEPDYLLASPGLAIDPVARHAYAVGQSNTIADVDLETLSISHRDLRRPAAHTKVVTGWHRQAVALGNGKLAVTGSDYDRLRRDASGLELVDAQSGTMRRLEPRASSGLVAGGMLLVAGAWSRGEGDWTGIGLAGYTLEGDKLWHVLQGESVSWVQSVGGYAYVVGEGPATVRVIDLADGSVRTLRGRMPSFVT